MRLTFIILAIALFAADTSEAKTPLKKKKKVSAAKQMMAQTRNYVSVDKYA